MIEERLIKLSDIDPQALDTLSDEEFQAVMRRVIELQAADRKENQLVYYQPASESCRRVHTTRARYVGIGGGNGACLPLHAPVMMGDGTYRPLGEINVGDMVMAADPATGETTPAKVLNTFRSGTRRVHRIVLGDGGSFEATSNHMVPMIFDGDEEPNKHPVNELFEPILKFDPALVLSPGGKRRQCAFIEISGFFHCGDIEVDHPAHCYITGDDVIVSNSKSDTCLAEIAALCTGVIPESVPELREKFRGPINCRIVVESLTTTLHTIILPKLQWFKWNGVSEPGGDKGHWGWVPKTSLIDASWESSWSEKVRVLRMVCRDPEDWHRVLGESTIQFMSHEQDPSDFASGDFHIVLHDEPTKHAIWVENQARTMRVNGVMMLAMTWPDDPAIPVDWIFDELYEPAQPGPRKSPHHAWVELSTRHNRNLDQRAIEIQAQNWDAGTRHTRLEGRPIRFSNRIHPLFTDVPMWWSFDAAKVVEPFENDLGRPVCPETGSTHLIEFVHCADFDPSRLWPTVFIIDPHPRKPHMFCWVQITPEDDYDIILEDELDGTTDQIAERVREVEDTFGLQVFKRLMDPNMGMQASAAGRDRESSWQQEFGESGLMCDLASDSDVGRGRINEYLMPDRYTLRPRIRVATRCSNMIHQMKRYCWDEHKRALDKDLKQKPKAKYDDYPTMLKYLMNELPTFRAMLDGPKVIHRAGMRGSGYGGRR